MSFPLWFQRRADLKGTWSGILEVEAKQPPLHWGDGGGLQAPPAFHLP